VRQPWLPLEQAGNEGCGQSHKRDRQDQAEHQYEPFEVCRFERQLEIRCRELLVRLPPLLSGECLSPPEQSRRSVHDPLFHNPPNIGTEPAPAIV
jgi:hypothetical protein